MGTSSSNLDCSTADDEGNAKPERVDPAGLGLENAAGLLPPTFSNCIPGLVFSNVSGDVRSDFTRFAMSLQTTVPVDGGENNIQAFRSFSVIDIIRFLEESNAEIRRESTRNMEEMRREVTRKMEEFYWSQIAMLTDEHQQQVTPIESRSMSEKHELSLSREVLAKELRDARAEVSGTNKLVQKMQHELDEVKTEKNALIKSRETFQKDVNGKKVKLEIRLCASQEAEKRKERDLHRLNELLQEKDKAIEEMQLSFLSQTALLTGKYQQEVTEIESRSMSEKQELSSSLEGVSKGLRDARAEVRSTKSMFSTAESELQDRKKLVQKMQHELDEMKARNNALIKSSNAFAFQKEMNAKKVELEIKLSHSQEVEKRKDLDVYRLNDLLKEKDKAIEEMQLSFLSQTALLTGKQQQQVTELESRAMSKIQELSMSLEGVSKELRDARGEVSCTKGRVSTAESELQDRNKLVQMMQRELDEVKARNNALIESRDTFQNDMNAKKEELEIKLNHSQEVEKRKDRDLRRQSDLLQEKEKAIGEMESSRNQLTSECEKLKTQLAAIELKSAQVSLTSGSGADDQWILIP